MCQANIELGYIGALVGQQYGETTLEAVKRMMVQARRIAKGCTVCGYSKQDISHDRASVVYSHEFANGEG